MKNLLFAAEYFYFSFIYFFRTIGLGFAVKKEPVY